MLQFVLFTISNTSAVVPFNVVEAEISIVPDVAAFTIFASAALTEVSETATFQICYLFLLLLHL
jgi:hypothetical protein